MNHFRMWRAWSLVLFYLATNMTSLTNCSRKAILRPLHTTTLGTHQNRKLRRCFLTLKTLWWLGWGFSVVSKIWTLNTCTPKVTEPSTVMHTSYPRSVLFFSFGYLHCLQGWCLFPATSGWFPTGRLPLTAPCFMLRNCIPFFLIWY